MATIIGVGGEMGIGDGDSAVGQYVEIKGLTRTGS